MPAFTYLSPNERVTNTSDKHINELVAEVIEKTGLNIVVHERVFTTKKIFRKPVDHKFYDVYIESKDPEFQAINFYAPDSRSTINLTTNGATVSAYLYGILVGSSKK